MSAPANLEKLRQRTARAMLAVALAAGVRVTEAELLEAIKGMSARALRTLPAKYARDIADLQAAGVDLNDPACFEGELSLDEVRELGGAAAA